MVALAVVLGGISGRKLYILGVAGFITPIWDLLVLQGEPEEAGEHIYGAKLCSCFPIRQMVPDGLVQAQDWCWACWAGWVLCTQNFIFS